MFHADNPAFDSNPLAGGMPRDPGVTNAGPQIVSYTVGPDSITFLENIGTFDPMNPLEIRGAGAAGTTAVGGLGFNVPSLLGVSYHAPYLHNGAAQTLEDLFDQHPLGAGTIATALAQVDQRDLLAFLRSIDGKTDQLPSDSDHFRNALGPQ